MKKNIFIVFFILFPCSASLAMDEIGDDSNSQKMVRKVPRTEKIAATEIEQQALNSSNRVSEISGNTEFQAARASSSRSERPLPKHSQKKSTQKDRDSSSESSIVVSTTSEGESDNTSIAFSSTKKEHQAFTYKGYKEKEIKSSSLNSSQKKQKIVLRDKWENSSEGSTFEALLSIVPNEPGAWVAPNPDPIYIDTTPLENNLPRLRELANKGNEYAQINLAEIYYRKGYHKKSIKYFALAADQGSGVAQTWLGEIYAEGIGVKKNYKKAKKYYKLAANKGYDGAQTQLGCMYYEGRGGKDYKKAKKYFELAAKKKNAYAQVGLAEMYEKGKGVKKNYMKKLEYYKLAADRGYDFAQFKLGCMYHESNREKAWKYYKLAMEQGDAEMQYFIGMNYFVATNGNYKKAYDCFELAANQGHALAQKQCEFIKSDSFRRALEENMIKCLNRGWPTNCVKGTVLRRRSATF